MTDTTKPPFQFPQFNMPGFPYASMPDQLAASFGPPNGQFTNGSQYGRWNGVNNNAFGLFPNQFQSLFGSPAPQPMQFQPPWGNNGYLGSNQGPGSNPGVSPPPPPQQPPQQPPGGGAPQTPIPGAVAGPGGTYPMPTSPNYIGNNRVPVGGVGPAPPGPPLTGTTAVGPGSMPGTNVPTPPGSVAPPATNVAPPAGSTINKAPLDNTLKIAGGPQTGLLSPSIPSVQGSNQQFSANAMPTGANSTSAALQHLMASGDGRFSGFTNQLRAQPQSYTPAQFNQVAGVNPGLAFTMASQGGQGYRNAIQQQNGWTPEQMNQFLNAQGYNNTSQAFQGMDPQNMALLRSLGIG